MQLNTKRCLEVLSSAGIPYPDVEVYNGPPQRPSNKIIFALLFLSKDNYFLCRRQILWIMGYWHTGHHESLLPMTSFFQMISITKRLRLEASRSLAKTGWFLASPFGTSCPGYTMPPVAPESTLRGNRKGITPTFERVTKEPKVEGQPGEPLNERLSGGRRPAYRSIQGDPDVKVTVTPTTACLDINLVKFETECDQEEPQVIDPPVEEPASFPSAVKEEMETEALDDAPRSLSFPLDSISNACEGSETMTASTSGEKNVIESDEVVLQDSYGRGEDPQPSCVASSSNADLTEDEFRRYDDEYSYFASLLTKVGVDFLNIGGYDGLGMVPTNDIVLALDFFAKSDEQTRRYVLLLLGYSNKNNDEALLPMALFVKALETVRQIEIRERSSEDKNGILKKIFGSDATKCPLPPLVNKYFVQHGGAQSSRRTNVSLLFQNRAAPPPLSVLLNEGEVGEQPELTERRLREQRTKRRRVMRLRRDEVRAYKVAEQKLLRHAAQNAEQNETEQSKLEKQLFDAQQKQRERVEKLKQHATMCKNKCLRVRSSMMKSLAALKPFCEDDDRLRMMIVSYRQSFPSKAEMTELRARNAALLTRCEKLRAENDVFVHIRKAAIFSANGSEVDDGVSNGVVQEFENSKLELLKLGIPNARVEDVFRTVMNGIGNAVLRSRGEAMQSVIGQLEEENVHLFESDFDEGEPLEADKQSPKRRRKAKRKAAKKRKTVTGEESSDDYDGNSTDFSDPLTTDFSDSVNEDLEDEF